MKKKHDKFSWRVGKVNHWEGLGFHQNELTVLYIDVFSQWGVIYHTFERMYYLRWHKMVYELYLYQDTHL